MVQVTIKEVLEATGGTLLSGEDSVVLKHISIDSRTMEGSDLFVPFIGARADAHDFIGMAFDNGAAASLSMRADVETGKGPVILVKDTLTALQDLGRWYRKHILKFPIVGITGSVGKTSTREMIYAALSSGLSVFSTKGNYNGQIGVPLTLSQMSPEDETAVLEMGMSLPGEMARISQVACVDYAVMTNIGISHIENLGSQENICLEKLHIIDGMKDGGVLFLNGDDPILAKIQVNRPIKTVFYGCSPRCQYRVQDIRTVENKAVFSAVIQGKVYTVSLKVPGIHNVMNAMAALAVASEMGISVEGAIEAIENFAGFARRLEISEDRGITIIDDAYNASPDSMKAALQVLDSMKSKGRKIAVLADMLELGEKAPEYHFETGLEAVDKRIDAFVLIGELASWIGRAIDQHSEVLTKYCRTNQEAADWLISWLKPGDMVLFKGSNSMKLKEVIDAVRQREA
ncbi:MAG: UDP-N-acetylmuramoyl-tripeptide--D-alanyl-D-alanine ligase [Lachnospiraceae bacterium]|nr:UDP-N-acetylmuramoyl-tripeptide--D-alanyl-D-alanine ligase [Lachnospiraceae bacterium]